MAKMNSGKIFENNFRLSVPKYAFYYRFKDSASSYYGGNQFLRFSNTNIADNLIFYDGKLYLNELKSHTGKSIPLDCIEGKKNKKEQIRQLTEADEFDNVYSYIIVYFSDIKRCFALNIKYYNFFKLDFPNKKSIPLDYFEKQAIELPITTIRTNFRVDIEKLFQIIKDQ